MPAYRVKIITIPITCNDRNEFNYEEGKHFNTLVFNLRKPIYYFSYKI